MVTAPRIDQPQPGYYRMRWRRGAVWVPVRIWRPCRCTVNGPDEHDWAEGCDRFPPLVAIVDGKQIDPLKVWTRCCDQPVTEGQYRFRMDLGEWSRDFAPTEPEANPTEPVDLGKMPPLYSSRG